MGRESGTNLQEQKAEPHDVRRFHAARKRLAVMSMFDSLGPGRRIGTPLSAAANISRSASNPAHAFAISSPEGSRRLSASCVPPSVASNSQRSGPPNFTMLGLCPGANTVAKPSGHDDRAACAPAKSFRRPEGRKTAIFCLCTASPPPALDYSVYVAAPLVEAHQQSVSSREKRQKRRTP